MSPVTSGNAAEILNLILERQPIVDTHNDFPYLLRVQLRNELKANKEFDFDQKLTSHTDLSKLRKGRVGVQFFSCFIDCPEDNYAYSDFNLKNSMVRDTLEQIDVTGRLIKASSDDLVFVQTADDALAAYKSGKIAIALGIEGLHQVDTSLAVLRQYYKLGVRYATLTHYCSNPFATSSSTVFHGKKDKGLSSYGESAVKEMNRLGMMVDLSHVSYNTAKRVLKISQAPVIFSHSSAYSLNSHERNVKDDVLMDVAKNGGVVQVNFFPDFIAPKDGLRATIDDAVNHIFHIANVAGWDCVGFGSDFEGIPYAPSGLEDVSKYPDLIYKCIQRGATSEQIEGLIGGNLFRVWKECEAVATKLQEKSESIAEKEWPDRIWEEPESAKGLVELYPGSKKLHEDTTFWKKKYFD
ncbi:uncharacterized protein PRCAT00005869001 [Priceomyces carsonii]|uniref:uncharacterized protein n=1 Tax=Priceomyces carsonii TaxID=28549 RepID=UPI002EDB7BD2|nr:unnamed protein product [Priceomyces carsonii]